MAERLIAAAAPAPRKDWLRACAAKKTEWVRSRDSRCSVAPTQDAVWSRPVLTQPAAIHRVARFAAGIDAIKFLDAGDVQTNGFQVVEDSAPFQTLTEKPARPTWGSRCRRCWVRRGSTGCAMASPSPVTDPS